MEILKQIEFSKLCRCCLGAAERLNIYETKYESMFLFEIIEKCTHSSLSAEDELPKSVCQSCFDKLTAFYPFLIKYQTVQNTLSFMIINKEHLTNSSSKQKDLLKQIKVKQDLNEDSKGIESVSLGHDNGLTEDDSDNNIGNAIEIYTIDSGDEDGSLINECSVKSEPLEDVKMEMVFQTDEDTNEMLLRECSEDIKNETMTFNCSVCHSSFQSQVLLDMHARTHNTKVLKIDEQNTESTEFKCTDCDLRFTYLTLLKDHCLATGHRNLRRFGCTFCTAKFEFRRNLHNHLQTHTKEKPYACNLCGLHFNTMARLSRHNTIHTGQNFYYCDKCDGKGFRLKEEQANHIMLNKVRRKRSREPRFSSREALNNYIREKIECKICKKMFNRSSMRLHMIRHEEGKNVLCNVCGLTFKTKSNLDKHMNKHTGRITYKCDFCGKVFLDSKMLKTHTRIHTGERPYSCDVCQRAFTQSHHLVVHKRTHTGARPYKCSECDSAFAQKINLTVHTRIHTGETPYHCSVCDKGFVSSSARRKHEVSVHKFYEQNKSKK